MTPCALCHASAAIALIPPADTAARLGALLLAVAAALSLHVAVRPYEAPQLNALEGGVLASAQLTLTAGVVLLVTTCVVLCPARNAAFQLPPLHSALRLAWLPSSVIPALLLAESRGLFLFLLCVRAQDPSLGRGSRLFVEASVFAAHAAVVLALLGQLALKLRLRALCRRCCSCFGGRCCCCGGKQARARGASSLALGTGFDEDEEEDSTQFQLLDK